MWLFSEARFEVKALKILLFVGKFRPSIWKLFTYLYATWRKIKLVKLVIAQSCKLKLAGEWVLISINLRDHWQKEYHRNDLICMQNFFKLKIILTYIFLLQVSTQLTIQNDMYFIVCIEALDDEAWNFLFCRCNKKKLAMKERYSTQHNSDSVAFSNEKKTFFYLQSRTTSGG